jgi:hypothetical protein
MFFMLYGTVKGKNINNTVAEKINPIILFVNSIPNISKITILPSFLNGSKDNANMTKQIQSLKNDIILSIS